MIFSLLKFLIFIFSIILFSFGLYNVFFNTSMQKCEMTYMYEYPVYKEIHYEDEKNEYRKYKIYNYLEGYDQFELLGYPILFIPGNAGSYRQVRSLASVSKHKSYDRGSKLLFNYFSVDFGEELSGFNGDLLQKQLSFLKVAINTIRELYPKLHSIILIGHSMGGFLARAIAIQFENVKLILTLASPLQIPVLGSDRQMVQLYKEINRKWSDKESRDVPIVSLTGGDRDHLVHDLFGRIKNENTAKSDVLWYPTRSVEQCGMSTDHLCIVWCKQIVLRLNKAMYKLLPIYSLNNHNTTADVMRDILEPKSVRRKKHDFQLAVSWFKLLFVEERILINSTTDYSIDMQSLTMVTRPMRLEVISNNCPDKVRELKISHVSPWNSQRHEYSFELSSEKPSSNQITFYLTESLLLGDKNSTSFLHVTNLHGNCHYEAKFTSNMGDWMASLLRLNAGKVFAMVTTILILSHQSSGLSGNYGNYRIFSASLFMVAFTVNNNLSNDFYWLMNDLRHFDWWDSIIMFSLLAWPLAEIILFFSSFFSKYAVNRCKNEPDKKISDRNTIKETAVILIVGAILCYVLDHSIVAFIHTILMHFMIRKNKPPNQMRDRLRKLYVTNLVVTLLGIFHLIGVIHSALTPSIDLSSLYTVSIPQFDQLSIALLHHEKLWTFFLILVTHQHIKSLSSNQNKTESQILQSDWLRSILSYTFKPMLSIGCLLHGIIDISVCKKCVIIDLLVDLILNE